MVQSLENSQPKEKYVIVMGRTGSGKSTFISTATKNENVVIGHGLNPATLKIQPIDIQHPEEKYRIVFVDTPGFDDACKSDTEIFTMVAEWFKELCRQEVIIAGIIYIHPITDNRVTGSLLKNLKLFKDMSGVLPTVTFVTTMWGEIQETTGIKREKQLKSEFWGGILQDGGRTKQFKDSYESAWEITESITRSERDHVLLTQEMAERRLAHLNSLVKDQKERIRYQARIAAQIGSSALKSIRRNIRVR